MSDDTRRDVAERLEEAAEVERRKATGNHWSGEGLTAAETADLMSEAAALLRSEGWEPDYWIEEAEIGHRNVSLHREPNASRIPVYFGTPSDSPERCDCGHDMEVQHVCEQCGRRVAARGME